MSSPSRRRPSRQRLAITALLQDREDFASAQDIHSALRVRGESIGLATVYRTLQSLWSEGEIDMLRNVDGEAVYRQCASGEHHHHLVCRGCHHTVEIEGPVVESWTENISAQHGYTDVSHNMEIFGLCAQCTAHAPTATSVGQAAPSSGA